MAAFGVPSALAVGAVVALDPAVVAPDPAVVALEPLDELLPQAATTSATPAAPTASVLRPTVNDRA